jgi:drug/metabolite transporter (DMT)-like permease
MANASTAAIFVCLLSPIIITIVSRRMFKEHLTKHQILGVCIAAGGTFTVIMGGTPTFSGSREFFLGSLILLSTPLLWTVYSLLGKKIMEEYSPFLITAYVTILGGLCLVPFSLAENSLLRIFSMTRSGWFAILFLSITCSLIGYYIWLHVLRQVGPAITSSFLFAEPLVTVTFAVMFVGEKLNSLILFGGLLIFLGVYLVTTRQRTESRRSTSIQEGYNT